MIEWLCTNERLNKRESCIFVEWSCANKKKKKISGDPNYWSNDHDKRKIEQKRTIFFLVELSCANKRNKSVGTLNSGQIVVHIASAKIPEPEVSISPSNIYGKLLD